MNVPKTWTSIEKPYVVLVKNVVARGLQSGAMVNVAKEMKILYDCELLVNNYLKDNNYYLNCDSLPMTTK